MSESSIEITKEIKPETLPMKPIERLTSLIISPGALMANIKAYPKAGLPLLICVLIALLTLPLTLRVGEIEMQEMSLISLERYGVDYFNLGATYDDDDHAEINVNSVIKIFSVIMVLVSYPFITAVSALLLFFLCKIMRSPGRFAHYFSLFAHIYIISAIFAGINMCANVVFDNTLNIFSLAAILMPQGNITSFSFTVLSAVNAAGVWMGLLIIIGIKTINDWTFIKSFIAGLIAFSVTVLIATAMVSSAFISLDVQHSLLNNL